jgi:hypothetical protein
MKLTLFLKELKEEFSFRDIEIENQLNVLSILERNLYGNGTNIRCIPEYFSKTKIIIQRNRQNWGSKLEGVKLVLYSNMDNLFFKALLFIPEFEIFNNFGPAVKLED